MDYMDNIWKAKVYVFLRGLMFFSGVLMPFLMEYGGVSFFQVMVIESVFVISVLIFEIPTGAIADRFGRKTSMILCSFSISIGVSIFMFFKGFVPFMIAEIFWGLGIALMSGASDALIYDSLKVSGREKDSKDVLGSYRGYNVLGIGVAALIGGFVASKHGYFVVMLMTFVAVLSSAFFAFTLKEPPITKRDKDYFELVRNGIKYFSRHKELKILAFDLVSNYVLFFVIFWSYQYYLRDMGIGLQYLGVVHFLIVVLEIYIMNHFGMFEKIFGKRDLVFYFGILSGFGALILAFSSSFYIAIPVIIIVLGVGFSREILFINYMNKHIESHNRSTVLSVANMFKALFSAIIYPLYGLMVEYNLNLALLIVGVLIIVFLFLSRVKEEHLID